MRPQLELTLNGKVSSSDGGSRQWGMQVALPGRQQRGLEAGIQPPLRRAGTGHVGTREKAGDKLLAFPAAWAFLTACPAEVVGGTNLR